MEEHIFHYGLRSGKEYHPRDTLLEMVRVQLQNILDIAVLTKNGEEIAPDGFRLFLDGTATHEIRNHEAHAILEFPDGSSIYEPRIDFIRKQIESLLSVVELESVGQPVFIDGFRLRNLSNWLTFDYFDSSEILEYAASRCNCDCVFCYNKGAPPSLALRRIKETAEEELSEIKTRLRYLTPDAGKCWDGIIPQSSPQLRFHGASLFQRDTILSEREDVATIENKHQWQKLNVGGN